MHLLIGFRVHEMKIVAFVIEIFEFDFVENRAVDKLFGAEAIVNHRAILKIFHARLHGAAFVAGSAVVDAKNREKLALVLDDHAGAKLCGFDAAHNFSRPCGRAAPKNCGFRKFRLAAVSDENGCMRNDLPTNGRQARGAPERKTVPTRTNSIDGRILRGQ
jgi:hypothetical protein